MNDFIPRGGFEGGHDALLAYIEREAQAAAQLHRSEPEILAQGILTANYHSAVS